jgi:hypothetical protein
MNLSPRSPVEEVHVRHSKVSVAFRSPGVDLPYRRSFAKKSPWEQVVVVGAHVEFPPVMEFVRNEMPYQGPAAAMYDVLKAVKNEICFFTARNAPFLNLRLIESPVGSAAKPMLPCRPDRVQPLYRRNGSRSVEGKSGGRKATLQRFSMKQSTRIFFRG